MKHNQRKCRNGNYQRDKYFLESKYKSYNESDISNYQENTQNRLNIDDKLSSLNNENHSICKKEIHDAYERGFLAGYFLGVNIMQQNNKQKDESLLNNDINYLLFYLFLISDRAAHVFCVCCHVNHRFNYLSSDL